MSVRFFLGANSPGGFFSYYGDWLDLSGMNRYFLIKGSPGNGKSTFMRRIGRFMEAKGLLAEYIMCSGDTESLDGVYIPALGTAFVDATPPHAIEPRYPLAVENYLPLTQFVNDSAVMTHKPEVIRLGQGLGACYDSLRRTLIAVKSLREELFTTILSPEALLKIARRTRGIIKREIKQGTGAHLHKRFLSALTPYGEQVLWDTVTETCDRVYEIEDNYHQAHIMLSPVLGAALEAGQRVYACYDPLDPDRRLEHLLMPELRLAFVTTRAGRVYPGQPVRRIRLDACIPAGILQDHRARLRFFRKTETMLLEAAAEILADCKEKHDRLEEIYNPHMDFVSLRALADAYAEKIYIDFAPSAKTPGTGAGTP